MRVRVYEVVRVREGRAVLWPAMSRAVFTRRAMARGRSIAILSALVASVAGCSGRRERDPAADDPYVFVVEALSRGSGVPAAARAVLGETRKLVESARTDGSAVSLSETRLGIEGETRLRVECRDPNVGREIYGKIRGLAGGVDLVSVTVLTGISHPDRSLDSRARGVR